MKGGSDVVTPKTNLAAEKTIRLHNDEKKRIARRNLKRSIPLLMMFIPAIALYVIFRFLPMFGVAMAFQDFNLREGIFGSPFVGLKYFKFIFSNPSTVKIILNTFFLGLTRFLLGIPFPILLAIMLNEVKNSKFKRAAQTAVYLPHFLSWVIVGGMIVTLFSQDSGFINAIIKGITGKPVPFLYQENTWLAIFYGSGIWKETGFSAIIYLAALAGIDQELYSAAAIDGASKIKQIFYITLPALVPTIVVNLILRVGYSIDVGFDQIYVLTNPSVNGIADVISTFVYRVGLQQYQFSLTSAMGLFQSVLGITLVYITNQFAKKTESSLW